MSNPTDYAAALKEIGALREIIVDAENKLKQGVMLDISFIEPRVAAVCDIAKTAEKEKASTFLTELVLLVENLNSYENELKRADEQIKNQLSTSDAH